MVEPLGTEVLVYLTLKNYSFTCLTDRKAIRLNRGEKIKVTFDLEKIHLFDRDTEKTII